MFALLKVYLKEGQMDLKFQDIWIAGPLFCGISKNLQNKC